MPTDSNPPDFPAGSFQPIVQPTTAQRNALIEAIRTAPILISDAVDGLSDEQLDTSYRNWTLRQIVHHVADSHAHCFLRYKLALTEDTPTIKPYDEAVTAMLADSKQMPIDASLQMLDAVHARWTVLLESMTADHFERAFMHPEHGTFVTLNESLSYYPWHTQHHAAQIAWVRENRLP